MHGLIHGWIWICQLPRFLGGERATPLDPLMALPRVNSQADAKRAMESFGEWEGYWGLQQPTPATGAFPDNPLCAHMIIILCR